MPCLRVLPLLAGLLLLAGCGEQTGGWPRDPSILLGPGHEPEGDANMDAERPALERYRAEHPGDVVEIALRRPFPDSVLLGVLTPDERARDRVEAALRPRYDERLCVVVSRSTRAQLQAADDDLSLLAPGRQEQGVTSSGHTISEDMQLRFTMSVVMVTQELQDAVDRHPAGLVHVEPWLTRA